VERLRWQSTCFSKHEVLCLNSSTTKKRSNSLVFLRLYIFALIGIMILRFSWLTILVPTFANVRKFYLSNSRLILWGSIWQCEL
jgi:hypothetical protein